MNSWASIASFALLKNKPDLPEKNFVIRFTLTWFADLTLVKSIVTTSAYPEQTTHQSYWKFSPVMGNKPILHSICLAKRSL
jgi:hypothetical protein